MLSLKVVIVGTSPAETLQLEEVLHQSGCLGAFRYIGLSQAMESVPDWDGCDLLIARYREETGATLLSFLAPVIRKSTPPVFFLVDSFDSITVNRLLNAGVRRVLPINDLEEVLAPCLSAVFTAEIEREPVKASVVSVGNVLPVQSPSASSDTLQQDDWFVRLFRLSPVGISVNRLADGKCVDCNDRFAAMLEWPRSELIGRDSLELGLSGDILKFFDLHDLPLDSREEGDISNGIQLERKIYTRTRQIRHVLIHMNLVSWYGENCLLSVVEDITEREQAKDKIKRLNDELERLVLVRTGALHAANRELAAEIGRRKVLEDFSNQLTQIVWETPDVVWVSAPDGKLQFLNKAGRAMYGVPEDAPLVNLDYYHGYPEDLRKRFRSQIQPIVVRDGIWRGETQFQLSDGRLIPLSQVLFCKKDDNNQVLFFASIARDVSDFKRVEHDLLQSRELYRTLAEAAHDLIFMVSVDGKMEYANGFACTALGISPRDVEGMPASQFFPKNFAGNHLQLFSEVQAIDRPVYTEGPFMRDGSEFWLGTWLVPIHNEIGGMISILGISRDVTEQKKTDEALQRALQNERRLGEMRSNFFSMTSHQFRTPLSTILLSAEMLQKYWQRWEEPKRNEHLARIQDAAKRLNSMLEDILVIGRVESGRYVASPKEFDIIAYTAHEVEQFSENDRGQHRLVFVHDLDNLTVYQDREVIHRVIDNLLSNAIKYSPIDTEVNIRIIQEEDAVLLQVSDQGIGIPEQDLKYLFQPFQRASNASEIPGTGIGLTIIQKSVELLNGTVSLKSKEGQGTTFVIRFPVRTSSSNNR